MNNVTPYIFDTLNNKFPCEGPRAILCACDFAMATDYDVDLKSLTMQGKISDVQSLFIDNADNPSPLLFVMSATNQRIIIPAYSQAYISVLLNQPQFKVSTSSPILINIYAQNFPVQNCVWSAPSNGTASSNVAVTNFPPSQMVTLSPTTSTAFSPAFPGQNIVTGAASTNTAIVTANGQNIRVVNTGTFPVSLRYGTGAQTAVSADLILMPNQSILLNGNGANNLAAISPGGVGSINITIGYGGLSA